MASLIPFFGLVGVLSGWFVGVVVDDVLALEGVSNKDEDGRIFCIVGSR